jgi:hypothetical protein
VSQIDSAQAIWFAEVVPGSAWAPPSAQSAGGNSADSTSPLQNVQQASGGITFGANVILTADALSQTPAQAAVLADAFQHGGVGMAGSSPQLAIVARAIAQKLVITADGSRTKFSLTLPESQLEQVIAFGLTRGAAK